MSHPLVRPLRQIHLLFLAEQALDEALDLLRAHAAQLRKLRRLRANRAPRQAERRAARLVFGLVVPQTDEILDHAIELVHVVDRRQLPAPQAGHRLDPRGVEVKRRNVAEKPRAHGVERHRTAVPGEQLADAIVADVFDRGIDHACLRRLRLAAHRERIVEHPAPPDLQADPPGPLQRPDGSPGAPPGGRSHRHLHRRVGLAVALEVEGHRALDTGAVQLDPGMYPAVGGAEPLAFVHRGAGDDGSGQRPAGHHAVVGPGGRGKSKDRGHAQPGRHGGPRPAASKQRIQR